MRAPKVTTSLHAGILRRSFWPVWPLYDWKTPMNIDDKSVVRLHYTVSDQASGRIESSREGQPLSFLYAKSGMIPGLHEALAGRTQGETFEITIPPEKAYGEYREGFIQRVPKKHFKGQVPGVGQVVLVPTREGQRPAVVHKIGMSVIDLDMNHPMAGKTLSFEIEIVEVREASAEELEHGHVHGEGGVQH